MTVKLFLSKGLSVPLLGVLLVSSVHKQNLPEVVNHEQSTDATHFGGTRNHDQRTAAVFVIDFERRSNKNAI